MIKPLTDTPAESLLGLACILFIGRLQLGQLWEDHCLAVPLCWMIIVIVLMVLLSGVELFQFDHFGHYLFWTARIFALFGYSLYHLFDLLLLLLVGKQYYWPVLRPHIIALLIIRGWIVDVEEHIQQVRVGNDCWIVMNLNNFSVSSFGGAYLLVSWVYSGTSSVPRDYVMDSF